MNELDKVIAKEVFGIEVGGAHYSSDIAEAFNVLTTMRAKGWFFRLDSYKNTEFICTLQNIDRKTFSVTAPSAAQAICECAARTFNVPTKEKN